MNELETLQKRADRERRAREEAERLLDAKAGEMSKLNQELHALTLSLAAREARSRAILETAAEGFISSAENGRITAFNTAANDIFGCEKGQAIGQPIERYIPVASQRLEANPISVINALNNDDESSGTEVKRSVLVRSEQCEGIRHDGISIPLSISASCFKVAGRHMCTWVVRDITDEIASREELERTQAQLLQSDKLASIGQLAAGVAHEINNPIGFISSNLNTLRQYAQDIRKMLDSHNELIELINPELGSINEKAEKVRKLYEELDFGYTLKDLDDLVTESIDGGERVRKIVADLRDFSHVDSPDLGHEDINDLIEKTINVAWNELKYKAEVVRQYGQLPDVPCYGGKLGQVILNLLVNAAHAIDDHGTITVSTKKHGGNARISISDTGCGIPQENLKRIFDPFFTTKEVGEGTGLGLHLTYSIVQSHGGRITAQSTVGQGSTFTIDIPLAGPPTEAKPSSQEASHATSH